MWPLSFPSVDEESGESDIEGDIEGDSEGGKGTTQSGVS